MVRSPDSLEAELLRQPPAVRARLAELLLGSLDAASEVSPDAAADLAWRVEGERRLAELRAGTITGIPASQVFDEVLHRLRA